MSPRFTSPSRRTFLKLMASAGAAQIFAPLLYPDVAEAGDAVPLRLVTIMSYHGKVAASWDPQGADTAFQIDRAGSSLAPLQPFRSRLFVPLGLDFKVLYDQGNATGHGGGPAALFTGSRYLGADGATAGGTCEGPSLDVFLASKTAGAPIRSIQIQNHRDWCSGSETSSYSETGKPLPTLVQPAEVYNRLFKGFTAPGTSPAPAPSPDQGRRRALASFWNQDLKRVRSGLAAPEQRKLDAHLHALNDIEQRIDQTTAAPAASTCHKPALPRTYSDGELSGCGDLSGEQLLPERTRLLFDILAEGLACGRTRFASFTLSVGRRAGHADVFSPVGGGSVHDDLAHQIGNAGSAAKLASLHSWCATQVAAFLSKLDQATEAGGSVLDHSLVMWGNELGNPSLHSNTDMPFVLAGGANGRLRMGRAVRYAAGTPHNRLLTTVAQAFDQQVTTFGNAAYAGTLPGLAAT